MPSAPEKSDDEAAPVVDEARSAFVEKLAGDLGPAIIEIKIDPGFDVWVRVTRESWADVANYLREDQQFRYFDWLSAIDWKQSPFGRSMEYRASLEPEFAAQTSPDSGGSGDDSTDSDSVDTGSDFTETGADGYAGGDTRFQVIARVTNLAAGFGVNLKVDLPGDDLTIATWINTYPGANWHEREAFEMFGISFDGHPKMQKLYLPTDFEGHPLRKDYPLVARMVKPWPGIVDVELMPEVEAAPPVTTPETAKPSTTPPSATPPPTTTPPATTPLGATTTNPEDGGVQ